MERDDISPTCNLTKCCSCGCSCTTLDRSLSGTYLRSVKRKLDELEEIRFSDSGSLIPQNARVDVENECSLLREMVESQQMAIQDLNAELDEERNASASATTEAMSMILRLQREKAEIEMEARQFRRFAEEKIAHDMQEMLALEDLLYKREQTIESLLRQMKSYKHRMIGYGVTEAEADETNEEKNMSPDTGMSENLEGLLEFSHEIYPSLRCNTDESHVSHDDISEVEAFQKIEDTQHSQDLLKDLENRLDQLEKSPSIIHPDNEQFCTKDAIEKVLVDHTHESPGDLRKYSSDTSSSPFSNVKELGDEIQSDSPIPASSLRRTVSSHLDVNSNQKRSENASEGEDNMSDRVCTVDSIHQGDSGKGSVNSESYVAVPVDDDCRKFSWGSGACDLEIQKLYARLHALEADRETMRQTIMSMGTDRAQLILLREIAQNLCKGISSGGLQSQKQTAYGMTSLFSIFKWISQFLFWRIKARRCRYMFGVSDDRAGLQLLLERGPSSKLSRLALRTSI